VTKLPEPFPVDPIVLDAEAVLNSTTHKWPGWWDNFAQNIGIVRAGKDVSKIPKRTGHPAVVVGAGPSAGVRELLILKEHRDKLTIISTDRMLKPLIQVGIQPDFVATVDGDPSVADFYNVYPSSADVPGNMNWREDPPKRLSTSAVLNVTTTHPKTVQAAYHGCSEVYWFNSFFDDPQAPTCHICRRVSPTAGFYFMSGGKTILQALGNVGAFGWHLGYFLGCNPVILLGMDYSYAPETPIEKTHYYDAYLKIAATEHLLEGGPGAALPQTQQAIEAHVVRCLKCRQRVKDTYQIQTNPDFQQKYLIDKIWGVYRDLLMPFIARAKCRTVNCSGGALHGPRISGMKLEDALAKFC
jgi:hypothetical protein